MLVPGEYLLMPVTQTKPVFQEPVLQSPANCGVQSSPPAAPNVEAKVVEAQETESRSFLLILLRALGAIHT